MGLDEATSRLKVVEVVVSTLTETASTPRWATLPTTNTVTDLAKVVACPQPSNLSLATLTPPARSKPGSCPFYARNSQYADRQHATQHGHGDTSAIPLPASYGSTTSTKLRLPPAPQQVDAYGRPLGAMQYNSYNMPYMAPPQANSPSFNQNFVTPYQQHSHSMSRTPSQPERPPSASQQNTPLIVTSTPQSQGSALKATANSFKVPKKSAAIQIKNAAGEVIDTSSFKTPSSPASSIQQSKTPPVVASSATPPPSKLHHHMAALIAMLPPKLLSRFRMSSRRRLSRPHRQRRSLSPQSSPR
ncbi:hypothetical protein NXS19_009068 [Fusarium pseudograminearum]|nr:hypothetical protein NXS19_009068 [Fusarium pseudograminearum]